MKKGLVIKSTGSWYIVRNKDYDDDFHCKIKGNFRIKNIKTTNPVTVGDWVDFRIDGYTNGLITKIYPRKNYIIRKSINLSKQAHIIASNIDQAILVATLASPYTTTVFIDRFLVAAETYKIPAKIIINKIDLYNEETMNKLERLSKLYSGLGYPVYAISAENGENIESVKMLMKDKINVVAGHSGVGKSTLINTISPGLHLPTAEISESHDMGKHTTTFSEMFDLEFGGMIIDTPGIKGFGMYDMKTEDVAHNFPEMFAKLGKCKYYNCTHSHEPECAVKEAIEAGSIARSRYQSYLSILEGEDDKYRNPE